MERVASERWPDCHHPIMQQNRLVVALRSVLSPGFLKNIKKKLKGAKSPHPENGVAKNIANVLSFKSMLASVQCSLSLTSWNHQKIYLYKKR